MTLVGARLSRPEAWSPKPVSIRTGRLLRRPVRIRYLIGLMVALFHRAHPHHRHGHAGRPAGLRA